MLDLTNREMATGILVTLFLGIFLVVPSLRRSTGPSFKAVIRAFFAWRLQLSLFVYVLYASVIVWLAHRVGFWDPGLLKDTIFVVVFAGVPLLFSAHKVADEATFLRSVGARLLGISAFIAFYVSLGSLPLWAELILQPVAATFAAVSAVAHHKAEHRPVEKLANGVLGLIGVGLLLYTTVLAFTTWDKHDLEESLRSFVLAVWLTAALVPFVYPFAFATQVGAILAMLPFFNERRKPPRRVRLAVVLGLQFRTAFAVSFDGPWRRRVAVSESYREARQVMADFRTMAGTEATARRRA